VIVGVRHDDLLLNSEAEAVRRVELTLARTQGTELAADLHSIQLNTTRLSMEPLKKRYGTSYSGLVNYLLNHMTCITNRVENLNPEFVGRSDILSLSFFKIHVNKKAAGFRLPDVSIRIKRPGITREIFFCRW
jgi:hypothetical protein